MNETIQLLHHHRSIRKFKNKQLLRTDVQTIVEAGQRASTSSNVMAYSVIGITDETIKKELQMVSGQPYVENNGYLFVICADFHRTLHVGEKEDYMKMKTSIESTEQFIVGVTDAALVTQNMAIAAESMGLGICFLGSLRNDINRVDELLELPEYVVPLYGLAVGYPDHQPEVKPRLPFEAIFHENKYNGTNTDEHLQAYDETMQTYYKTRSTNKKVDNWTEQMKEKFLTPTRVDVAPYIQNKNLNRH